jgi:glycolate oxidase FAD binding subunit
MSLSPSQQQWLDDAVQQVRTADCVALRGGGSKSAMIARDCTATLEMSQLSGIIEYDPSEFTFTALAGTSLAEIDAALAAQGQYLPFDPPLVNFRATLGGTIAAGASGSGRLLYGGARDFILGIQFIDGAGNLVRAGGKVVKNAAGFDLPKFFVGSRGRFGALTELTFKVFPRPRNSLTLVYEFDDLPKAVDALVQLTLAPLQLGALDLQPLMGASPGIKMFVRIHGESASLEAHGLRIDNLLTSGNTGAVSPGERITEAADARLWRDVQDFSWVGSDQILCKVATTVDDLESLEEIAGALNATRRYCVAGNLSWLGIAAKGLGELDGRLREAKLSGMVIRGSEQTDVTQRYQLGTNPGIEFLRRVKTALDPHEKFGALDK